MPTNSEILRTPKALLAPLDAQRRFLLLMASQPLTCPACHTGCSQIEANDTAKGDVDAYDTNASERDYHCTGCRRALVHCVYFIGGHGWALAEAEAAQLLTQGATPTLTPTEPT